MFLREQSAKQHIIRVLPLAVFFDSSVFEQGRNRFFHRADGNRRAQSGDVGFRKLPNLDFKGALNKLGCRFFLADKT